MKRFLITSGLYFLTILLIGSGCKKIEVKTGYFGKNIRYRDGLVVFNLGQDLRKNILLVDGSSTPIKVELTGVRKLDGSPAPELTTPVDVVEFVKPYTRQEKTLEEYLSKLAPTKAPLLQVRETDGAIQFRKESWDLDTGTYVIDIKVSNSAGEREIKEACIIKIEKGKDAAIDYIGTYAIYENGEPGGWDYYDSLDLDYDECKLEKISDEGNKISIQFIDWNGNIMNPKDWPERVDPGRNNYRMKSFTFDLKKYDDRWEYDVVYPFHASAPFFEWWVPARAFPGNHPTWDVDIYTAFHVWRPGTWRYTIKFRLL